MLFQHRADQPKGGAAQDTDIFAWCIDIVIQDRAPPARLHEELIVFLEVSDTECNFVHARHLRQD